MVDEALALLAADRKLSAGEWDTLFGLIAGDGREQLAVKARETAFRNFGGAVFVRALIEVSSCCRNNCLYCGLRRSNSLAVRYRLSKEQILECCNRAARYGFNTFVLQGGEDPAMNDEWLVDVVESIHRAHPGAAITLSLGERSRESYRLLRLAGACRYLLRHETADDTLYSQLHPSATGLAGRKRALCNLKELGYQVGSGMMLGVPGQQREHLVKDLMLLDELRPQMIGIGPFVPAGGTPFAKEKAGSVDDTVFLISLLRLRFPRALIPATTAVATMCRTGTERAVMAGANVVMPNFTPPDYSGKYTIYDNKKCTGSESGYGLELLEKKLNAIGCHIDYSRGDYITAN